MPDFLENNKVSDKTASDEENLTRARELVQQIEAGNESEAARILDELTFTRQEGLFQEVGKLTRDLHDALNSFRLDSRITDLAAKEIPDAKERLKYVITKTEEAADRTLTAVEDSIPLCEGIDARAGALSQEWERFTRREMQAAEFRELSRSVADFLGFLSGESLKLKNNLNDVLMAQDFQDLTGQVIRRVITLVADVEDNLVNLVRVSGKHIAHEAPTKKDNSAAEGPQVPGLEHANAVSGQDEVDDLLSSLGF